MLNAILGGFVEKMQRYEDYIKALEEERRKIQVFERELPLCMELVTQAIETCRHQLSSGASTEHNENAQSDSSEQISSDRPVFEEFIPLKRISSHPDLVEEQEPQEPRNLDGSDDKDDQSSKKPDWLRSVQLWNQTPDLPTNSKQNSHRKVAVVEVKRNGTGGAFHPFKKEKTPTVPAPAPTPTQEAAEDDGVGVPAETDVVKKKKEEKYGHSSRKSRRCWSPELHKRFLQALERLGGSHVATPKQIRELMKMDGLTNDEVKSHLQKYRLHTRRPSPSTPVTVPQPQVPQFVVVGGIWVPPEYASQAAASVVSGEASGDGSACREIYVPVATHPPSVQNPNQRLRSDCRSSDSGGEAQSHSSATSSSSMRLREIATSNSAGH